MAIFVERTVKGKQPLGSDNAAFVPRKTFAGAVRWVRKAPSLNKGTWKAYSFPKDKIFHQESYKEIGTFNKR